MSQDSRIPPAMVGAAAANVSFQGPVFLPNTMDQLSLNDSSLDFEDYKSDPVFKKFSKVNGLINRMSLDELRSRLRMINMDDVGSFESCKRRLKSFYKNEASLRLLNKPLNQCFYDAIIVIDFEATCDKETGGAIIQEIIEFPALLVDVKNRAIVSSFHEFVKPQINSKLTPFCNELTGITQEVIDSSDNFEAVLDRFEDWLYGELKKNKFGSFAFATDGPWDLAHFFARQCSLINIPYPAYAKRWINIKKVFSNHYKTQSLNLTQMLTHLGMEFEGRKHSGYDDTTNITKVLLRMLLDGSNPTINERISWRSSNRSCWGHLKSGVVRVLINKPNDGLNLSDSDDPDHGMTDD